MYCKQCPPTKITISLTLSLIGIWLAASLQCPNEDLLSARIFFHDHRERAVGGGVKENRCYIAFEYDTELTSTAERSDYLSVLHAL